MNKEVNVFIFLRAKFLTVEEEREGRKDYNGDRIEIGDCRVNS